MNQNTNIADEKALRKAALAVATLSAFVTPFMGSAIMIALPSIGDEFNMDAVLLSWVATSYLLSAAVFLVPFGRAADIYGRKRIFNLGMIIFTLSSLIAGLSVSTAMLIIARVIQGAGSAMIFANGIAILTSAYPPQERGKVLGINVAAVYVGLSAGPFLGGLLTQHLTWRSVFLVTVPLGIAVIVLTLLKLKREWADAAGEQFDYAGSIIYGIAIVAIIYGLSILPEMTGLWLSASGVAGILAFIVLETRVKHPVFEMRLFGGNRTFALSNLAAFINYTSTSALVFMMSLYLQHIKGLDPQDAGTVLIAQPIFMAAFSPLAGRLSDRIEPRVVATAGISLTAVGLGMMVFLDTKTEMPYIIVSLVVLGTGFAFFSSPNVNAIFGSVEKRYYGIASGSVGTMRLLGQMFSMGIATLIFALVLGRVRISPKYFPVFIKSVHIAFTVFTIICFLGVLASLFRGRIREEQGS